MKMTLVLNSCADVYSNMRRAHTHTHNTYDMVTRNIASHTLVAAGNWGPLGQISGLGGQGRAFLTERQITQLVIGR